jgi:hypothetical protein
MKRVALDVFPYYFNAVILLWQHLPQLVKATVWRYEMPVFWSSFSLVAISIQPLCCRSYFLASSSSILNPSFGRLACWASCKFKTSFQNSCAWQKVKRDVFLWHVQVNVNLEIDTSLRYIFYKLHPNIITQWQRQHIRSAHKVLWTSLFQTDWKRMPTFCFPPLRHGFAAADLFKSCADVAPTRWFPRTIHPGRRFFGPCD